MPATQYHDCRHGRRVQRHEPGRIGRPRHRGRRCLGHADGQRGRHRLHDQCDHPDGTASTDLKNIAAPSTRRSARRRHRRHGERCRHRHRHQTAPATADRSRRSRQRGSARDAAGNAIAAAAAHRRRHHDGPGRRQLSDIVWLHSDATGQHTRAPQRPERRRCKRSTTRTWSLISIDNALQQLATSSAQLGAYQNRFQAAITGLNTDSTNLSSAKSAIVDTDYAAGDLATCRRRRSCSRRARRWWRRPTRSRRTS